MSFSYTLIDGWFQPESLIKSAPLKGFSSLGAQERMILLSDGSLTFLLEALMGARVDIEVKLNDLFEPGGANPLRINGRVPVKSLEREVWLVIGGEKLVYAHMTVAQDRIEPWLLSALKDGAEPLGRVLNSREIPVLKQSLEVAVVTAPKLCEELNIAPDTELYARRYRLTNKLEDGRWLIEASICEVLTPRIISVE